MKDILQALVQDEAQIKKHFHHLHQNPELGFEEVKTAAYVAAELRTLGYEVTEGIGKTGVVGKLVVGDGKKSIGLRADMDALPIQEMSDLPCKSQVPGKAHMCGHDAHTSMLLGAARHLAKTRNFNGTLNLIFQPAEEIMGGAAAMLADGLFERFPMDVIFGLHGMPGLPKGKLHFTSGPIMAAVDNWEIRLTGKGGHGSMPEKGVDPIVAGSALVMALQSIVSRNVAPKDTSVITVGAFLAGDAGNVIPHTATLRLSMRHVLSGTRQMVLERVRNVTAAIAAAYGTHHEIMEGQSKGGVLVNDQPNTEICIDIAKAVLGAENVITPGPTYMGSEDFAYFAEKIPSVYAFLGGGDTPMPHHPMFVFDESNLAIGAAYWVAVAESYLKQ